MKNLIMDPKGLRAVEYSTKDTLNFTSFLASRSFPSRPISFQKVEFLQQRMVHLPVHTHMYMYM